MKSDQRNEVTMNELRRLLFWVHAVHRALATADPYEALSDVYRYDEHLIADYDEDGMIRPSCALAEYHRALATLEALAVPRPDTQQEATR